MCPTCRSHPIQDPFSVTSNNFESLLDVTNILPETDDEVCRRHNKPYQAFCSTEQQLLCIECLLEEQHKKHKIQSLNDACT